MNFIFQTQILHLKLLSLFISIAEPLFKYIGPNSIHIIWYYFQEYSLDEIMEEITAKKSEFIKLINFIINLKTNDTLIIEHGNYILNIVNSDEFKEKFNENNLRQCSACNNQNPKLKCSNCKLVYYCNRECQLKDWKERKLVCKKLICKKK